MQITIETPREQVCVISQQLGMVLNFDWSVQECKCHENAGEFNFLTMLFRHLINYTPN